MCGYIKYKSFFMNRLLTIFNNRAMFIQRQILIIELKMNEEMKLKSGKSHLLVEKRTELLRDLNNLKK